jgi:DNA-binding transcriptional LysR family regulator
MAPALANLVTAHPKLRYEVEVEAWSVLRERLLNRHIDLHVGAPPEIYGDEVSTIEFAMPPPVYFCRSGHPLARKNVFPLEEVLLYPRISIEAPPAWTRMYAKVFGFEPNSEEALHFRFAKSNDWEILKTIVRMTDSISAGPREVVREELDAGVLQELSLDLPAIELFATVAYLSDRVLPPAAEALIREVKKVVQGQLDSVTKQD